MRAIGELPVVAWYIGARHVISRYVGDELIFEDYIHEGLLHRFDGRNNTGEGYDPDSAVWVDLVTGNPATLEDAFWQDFGVVFSESDSKVVYSGQSVGQYTIFSTHRVLAFQGFHPRFFGETPYPTLYLHSNNDFAYAFFGQGKDTYFSPQIIPPLGSIVQAAVRFGGTGVIDLFFNGQLVADLTDVTLYPVPVPTMYIGNRATNDRALTGEVYEHLVYNRPLSDAEVLHNFRVSSRRYQL